jgi:phage shock protein E
MRILVLTAMLTALACQAAEAPTVTEISREELAIEAPETRLILDVRTPEEFAAGHVENAVNIPHDQIAGRLPEIERYTQAPVVIYCRSGRRAGLAAEVLSEAGFTNLLHLTGDMDGWIAAGLPVETDGS